MTNLEPYVLFGKRRWWRVYNVLETLDWILDHVDRAVRP